MFLQPTKAALLLLIGLMISVAGAGANDGGHLIPLRPNFDVGDVPHGKKYARLCEEKLFAGSSWIVRYHGIGESAETGLSITKQKDGKFVVTVKQAQPPLGSTLFSAFDAKLDVKTALKTVRVEEAHAEIPEAVAMAVCEFWISLLRDVQPHKPGSWSSISKSVRLYAKSAEGKTLAGRLPPDAFKYKHLNAVESIFENLLRVCAEQGKSHKTTFDRIQGTAHSFTTARSSE